MKGTFIPCCYFPTTLVFVDDNQRFLNSIQLKFSNEFKIRAFINPSQAVNFLKNEYNFDPISQRIIQSPDWVEEPGQQKINISFISQEIYNNSRFNQIAVLVIDYAMPAMTGIDICRQLPKSPIRKILLTGDSDEKVTITAFNEKIIDQSIGKDQPDLVGHLEKSIEKLQLEYFQLLSKNIIDSLGENCLEDPIFITFFNNLLKEKNIVEYYLLDISGSFLLLTADGKPYWLAVKREQDMILDSETADSHDAPESIQKPLQQREKLAFFFSPEDFNTQPTEWQPYMHPAQKLIGNQTYYVSLIEEPCVYKLEKDKILSFSNFLEE